MHFFGLELSRVRIMSYIISKFLRILDQIKSFRKKFPIFLLQFFKQIGELLDYHFNLWIYLQA